MNTELELLSSTGAVERIAELAREAATPGLIGSTPYILQPADSKLVMMPELRERPQRVQQVITLHTPDALIAYYNRFARPASIIGFDRERGSYTAILDYHDAHAADWCEHRATYQCPRTPEWTAWEQASGKAMSQIDFALFIEQNVDDIRQPAGAEMLEIVTTLKAQSKVEFSKAIRLANGQNEFTYNELIDGKAGPTGQLRIPEEITLGITPFQGSDAYEVRARFRYRISAGHLSMWYDLIRPHKVNEAALADITAKISAAMHCGLLLDGRI